MKQHHLSIKFMIFMIIGGILLISCNPDNLINLEKKIINLDPTSTIETEEKTYSLFGIEMSAITFPKGIDQANEMGTDWIRKAAIQWNEVEKEEGVLNWDQLEPLEQELLTAKMFGKQVILIVRGTPEWAQALKGHSCGPISSDKLDAFGIFLEKIVKRYSVPPFNVLYWEIWNEPDIDPDIVTADSLWGCWGDETDEFFGGGTYADLLKVVYPRIKQIQPLAQVLVGGLVLDCDPTLPDVCGSDRSPLFLEGILRNRGGSYFDGISFHSYDYYWGEYGTYIEPKWRSSWETTGPVVVSKTKYLKKLLLSYDIKDKILINSETALLCGLTGTEEICQTDVFESTKANYVAQSYAAALFLGLKANIWYSFSGWRGSGLVDNGFNPNPAYHAYQFAAGVLTGLQADRELTEFEDMMGYSFYSQDRRVWVIWSTVPDGKEIQLVQTPKKIYDVLGNAITVKDKLTVDLSPVYIEW